MARVVKHDAQAPYEIAEGTELPIYICGCGLSKNKPYCDGSHKKTRAEAAGEVYEYDENGNAKLVAKH
jgi:CDGSH-type Zn-finger protein